MSTEISQSIDPVPYMGGSMLDIEATLGEIQRKIEHLPDYRAQMADLRQAIVATPVEKRWGIVNRVADAVAADIILARPMTERGEPFGAGKIWVSNEIKLPERP